MTTEIDKILEDYIINAKELEKAFTGKITEDFLNDTLKKTYYKLKKIFSNPKEINDLIRVSEAIILYSRGEYLLNGAKIYLAKLCCFKHQNENETLVLYIPSYWILDKIYQKILKKIDYNFKNKNEVINKILKEIKNKNFPIIPENRLKLRIEKYIRSLNEKTIFDYVYDY